MYFLACPGRLSHTFYVSIYCKNGDDFYQIMADKVAHKIAINLRKMFECNGLSFMVIEI